MNCTKTSFSDDSREVQIFKTLVKLSTLTGKTFSIFLYIFEIYMLQKIILTSVDPVTQVEQKSFPYLCFYHFLNWKYFFNVWKIYLLLSSLLQSILGRGTAPTRRMQIYLDVGVSLPCFKYLAQLKKLHCKCNGIN